MSTTADRTVAGRLAAIVGAEGVRTGGATADWGVHGVRPRAVVAPRSPDEVAAVLALATEEGWVVEPAGAGTALDWGRRPRTLDLVLTVERLNALDGYEPADLTIEAGAGAELAALAERLRREGQWLPLDPAGRSRVTMGAVVSTAAAGPLRLGYGTPRGHVLGLELVTGDGRVLGLGGRVVKNVAGYDLVKLATGAHGTLGIITRLHLRLRPLPERDVTLVLRAAEPAPLLDIVRAARDARLDPAALELVSPPLARRITRAEAEPGWLLLARVLGGDDASRHLQARLEERAAGSDRTMVTARDAAELWRRLSAAEAAAALVVRLAARPGSLATTLAHAGALAPATGRDERMVDDLAIAAHAGDGIVRLLISAADYRGTATEDWATSIETGRELLADAGGSVIAERLPADLAGVLDPFGSVGPALRLMRGLRDVFDPGGILARGRYVLDEAAG